MREPEHRPSGDAHDRPVTDTSITGAVLAGGRGRRMGGADKGLAELAGRPLAAHVLGALRPQVRELFISANRNLHRYAGLGVPVLPDLIDGFHGPLAGMASVAAAARTSLVVTVPCDVPYLPRDLVARLARALTAGGHAAAVAHDGRRLHPAIALFRRSLAPGLEQRVRDGDLKVMAWAEAAGATVVDFSDCAACFANVNTDAQLRELQGILAPCQ